MAGNTAQHASAGLTGCRSLVLGGGYGIGEAVSHHLAALGAAVGVVDIEADRAKGVAAEIEERGGRAVGLVADVLDETSIKSAFDECADALGGEADRLANIVGMASWAPALELTDEQWDGDFSRNVRYVWYAARELTRRAIERDATAAVVSVSSVDGLTASPGHSAYGAAKAALVSMTMSMAQEWAPRVRVNAVAPGIVKTPRAAEAMDAETEQRLASLVPMARLGAPEDIARVVGFLLDDASAYVTGQTIVVDGGVLNAGRFAPVRPGS